MVSMLLAGFGGQGVLFAGKVAAYAGLIDEKYVSWLPSYGPEMRGGTANCSVCISEEPIGSPLVLNPDVLIAMNLPSYDKFIDKVVPGGIAVIDSSLIDKKCDRTDIKTFYIPATTLADKEGLKGLANIIILGKVLAEAKFASYETVEKAILKCVPPKKQHLAQPNLKAIKLGMSL
ncbi:2-oxoacid:acceptor oxidoreductase family protein [Youxingia wuxianensis]|uniref:2-oxoacid:acceptor oxidoreductase family protein n=1 Tax=Youxingia wuxianensis TaxID=2763678 RepID=A0A926EL57_9FIRM|nr:2-oxoacid:acceptor oxidoreductase family protein [Youxingia wuxianensis]MBC8584390.1 2-oxoacid:acceptor oxidoreductase family protein [Youxingia wuxianensis]